MSQVVTIKVEQKHVDRRGEECNNCPVFHALMDAGVTGGFEVFETYVAWACPVRRHAVLPVAAGEFIGRNDTGLPTEPFEFELTLPDGVTITTP